MAGKGPKWRKGTDFKKWNNSQYWENREREKKKKKKQKE